MHVPFKKRGTPCLMNAIRPTSRSFRRRPVRPIKPPTVEDALAAAAELKPMIGAVRRIARDRRAAIAQWGKMALPPEER